jgi:hypothetical protein
MPKNLSEALAESGTMFKHQFVTREQVKGKASRSEAVVKREVRKACVERDGRCRVASLAADVCKGPSEWAHLAGHRRSQTRGLPVTIRHNTRWTMMLCNRHHKQEEDDKFHVIYKTAQYADGAIGWEAVK